MSFEKLNELLDVDPNLVLTPEVVAAEDVPVSPAANTAITVVDDAAAATTSPALPVEPAEPVLPEMDVDVDYARTNISDAISKVTVALTDAISLAQSGDNPRAYEVVGNMLTAIVNANKELVDIHRVKEDTLSTHKNRTGQSGDQAAGTVNIEKAVFIGRPQDLIRELRKATKQLKEEQKHAEESV